MVPIKLWLNENSVKHVFFMYTYIVLYLRQDSYVIQGEMAHKQAKPTVLRRITNRPITN